jgi:hypothetical protein
MKRETSVRLSAASCLAALLALVACGPAGGEGEGNAAGPDVPAGQSQLAEDPELANQAAAAEALDTELYGGNAAAGEVGNASAAQIPTHSPAEGAPPATEPPGTR